MIGRNFLHYKIIEKLGSGGRGVVYKAEDTKLKRIVALKCLLPQVMINSDDRKRFEQEAQAAARLNHPGIATIYGLEEIDNQMYIIMEFIEGQDLRGILESASDVENTPILSFETVLNYAIKIIEALLVAHENGIVHRDIKPENIMINTRGEIKIMDFGLAKITGSELLTKIGEIMGTVAYMSPEQLSGQEVDQRTDIWSLGVMLYEMISGERPFSGQYEQAIIYSILNETPKPMHPRYSDIPQKLLQIIHKTLAKNPADRYQNCKLLLNDLKQCLQETGKENTLSSTEEKRHHELVENTLRNSARGVSNYIYVIKYKLKVNWKYVIIVLLLVVISMFIIVQKLIPPDEGSKKIAVLPFVNINNDPADEYFSDGIMEDILTQLVKIGDLKVISRTTMMTYKNSAKTLVEISKELNAEVVLEGSVRRDSNEIRIAVQLIDANSDEHLWAETYDRELSQVFIVQSEIAHNIANALHASLSTAESNRLKATGSSSPEVYNIILKGGYYLTRGSRVDVDLAIDQFQQAVLLDANNARAWAQLATAYARQADLGAISSDEGYSKARQAAKKALELDDQLAQGHTIMGWIKRSYDWDWEGAEIECRKALEIAPGDVTVIRNMANMEKSLGRFDRAIALMQKAAELDPRKVPIYTSLGLVSMYANRLEEAEAAYRRAIEINPNYPVAHTFLGLVFLLQGKADHAIAEIQKETDEGWRLYGLAQAYYGANRIVEADAALRSLIEKYGDDSAYQVAEVYAYRGEADTVFEWLEKAYALRDGGLSELKGDPFMKNIEKDPRYKEFLNKMKLPI